MKEIKTISVKCDTKDTLNIAEMTELQGNLKSRNDVDYDKIKLSIIKYGFSFPFFVWKSDKNYILDGHGRFETLCRMQKDGYLIPDVPVVFVEAKDLKEAKQKLLRLNSQYGKMTKESVLEFAEDIDLNFNPAIVELVKGGYKGFYNYKRFKPEFVTREMFTELKDKDPYIKYIWSFGNTGKSYMFGKDVEPIKHIAHDFVVFGKWNEKLNKVLPNVRNKVKANTIHQRRIEFCGYARQLNKRTDLQQLEQLERLQQLEQLEPITFNCGSLFDYQYQEGDVVYIDPPYESEADYDGGFDFQKFYDWVYSQPYQIWFSGYKISDKRFKMIWARELRSSYGTGNKAINFECLYTNK